MADSIRIELLEEKVIGSDCWYPNLLADQSGNLLLGLRGKPEPLTLFSGDSGKSWREISYSMNHYSHTILRDGSVLAFDFLSPTQHLIRKEQEYKPFIAAVRRAKSIPGLLGGYYEDDFVKLDIPDLSGTDGDDQNYCAGCIDHGLVQLPNGDLLITMYGRFRQDNVRVPYFPEGAYQYRTWVCRSRDGGKTWAYLSTVGANEILPLPERAEGWCEPDLIDTGGGSLLCVMRTGGSPHKGSPERYTDLYASHSADGGESWGLPKPIAPWGVWPRLLRMSNGVIALASGRPGVFLLFSADGGQSWTEPQVVTDFDDDWNRCSSGYNCIAETAPGVLSLFYDDVDPKDDSRVHFTKQRNYRVSL